MGDLIIRTEAGPPSSLMSSEVNIVSDKNFGAWISSSTGQASGFSSLQYDGLEGTDLTVGGKADGFLIQAQATFATDFKFTVFGEGNSIATAAKQIVTNNQTYYYLSFGEFNGETDFSCAGAIEITATIQPFSRFVVNTLTLGTYTPDSPSLSPSVSAPPSKSPTPSRVASEYIEGPTTATSTPTPLPSVAHQCLNDDDCAYLESGCVVASCENFSCVTSVKGVNGCCNEVSDCEHHDCERATCNEYSLCSYVPIACIESYSKSPAEDTKNDDGGNGWIAGVVLGAVGVVAFLVIVVLVIVIVVMKKRSASSNSTSVYDAMIGDM